MYCLSLPLSLSIYIYIYIYTYMSYYEQHCDYSIYVIVMPGKGAVPGHRLPRPSVTITVTSKLIALLILCVLSLLSSLFLSLCVLTLLLSSLSM